MLDVQNLIQLAVISVVCFVGAFYFFNKIMNIDKPNSNDKEKAWTGAGGIKIMDLRRQEKKWHKDHPDVTADLYKSNVLLKMIKEEGLLSEVAEKGAESKSDVAGIFTLADYFETDSDSQKKLMDKINKGDVEGLIDFNKKTLDYICYFLEKYDAVKNAVIQFKKEGVLTARYKDSKDANRRMYILNMYLVGLEDMVQRAKDNKENSEKETAVSEIILSEVSN